MHRLKLTYTDCRIEVIKRMREQYICMFSNLQSDRHTTGAQRKAHICLR